MPENVHSTRCGDLEFVADGRPHGRRFAGGQKTKPGRVMPVAYLLGAGRDRGLRRTGLGQKRPADSTVRIVNKSASLNGQARFLGAEPVACLALDLPQYQA